MAGDQVIKVAVEERLAVVTIDNPPYNVLSHAVLEELNTALQQLVADQAVKALMITGAGSMVFIAGADVREIAQLSSANEAAQLAAMGQGIIQQLERSPKPTIAAINGVCLGGGNELAMACHLRVAGDRARFGQPEITLGIIPGFGGTQRLTRLVGRAKSIELNLTGDMITAQEALRIGLVNKVVGHGEVLKQAKDLARKILSKGQVAVRLALQAIQEGAELPLDQALALESQLFGQVAETADMKEGIAAFREKRQPKFQDR